MALLEVIVVNDLPEVSRVSPRVNTGHQSAMPLSTIAKQLPMVEESDCLKMV